MTEPQVAAQSQGAEADLQIPPVFHLRVTPQVFDLVRRQLGKLPYDEIGGLCQNLEAQATEQIQRFNTPAEPPTPHVPAPVNRAARRAVKKPGAKVTPIARAAAANSEKVGGA